MTKIIFMGTPAFSATVLEGLLTDEHYDIVAVVTQPDRAVGRKKEIRMTPVKELALAHELPIYQPEKLSGSEEMVQLISLGADGIVTAAYGQFLPSKLLDSMDFAVNVHASLLPKYRGGAPIHYAIINGDAEAGVTIMEMVKEMDAGDMSAKRPCQFWTKIMSVLCLKNWQFWVVTSCLKPCLPTLQEKSNLFLKMPVR